MNGVGGSGLAAVAALKISLESGNSAAISTCLQLAKGMPDALKAYAAGAALWADGKKAGAFGLWPGEFPHLGEEVTTHDWHGWELALPDSDEESLFDAMEKELATLRPDPEAAPEVQIELATRLLDPETTATFGPKRVRDAMMACADVLADEPMADGVVGKMVQRARLAGAPHIECLRIEARVFMAAGDFSSGYARWLQVIESEEGEIQPADYVQAARCVMEDMQPGAAIELLTRGRKRFPTDPGFALDAAWLLLGTGHPEDSGVMLEHGFTIPFTQEQQQTALAMLICAAEQTERTERANTALAELLQLSPDWGTDEFLGSLDWPEALKQSLLAVAQRNR
jgi:hypothetical protein